LSLRSLAVMARQQDGDSGSRDSGNSQLERQQGERVRGQRKPRRRMSANMSPLGIAQRYARALRLTAPKLATRMPMAAAEGYWLTDTLYFFLHQQPDTSTERIVVTPCIADCEARTLEKVI